MENLEDQRKVTDTTVEVYFSGAGIDGDHRYEIRGLAADTSDLTLDQLCDTLKKEGGLSDHTIGQDRQQISDLAGTPVMDGHRPLVSIRL